MAKGEVKEEVVIRQLTSRDIKDIMAVEIASWPISLQASKTKLLQRLEVFPEGFLGAYLGGKLVGFATSQIINYNISHKPKTFLEMTNRGQIASTHKPAGNAIYLVSVGVIPMARRIGIGKQLLLERLQLAKRLKLKWAVVNVRVPFYAQYCKKHGKISVKRYVENKKDLLVNMYLKQGFSIKGILPKNLPDPESKNWGVFMVKKL